MFNDQMGDLRREFEQKLAVSRNIKQIREKHTDGRASILKKLNEEKLPDLDR